MKDVTNIHLRLDEYIYIKSHTIILRMFFLQKQVVFIGLLFISIQNWLRFNIKVTGSRNLIRINRIKSRERKFRLSYIAKHAVDTSCATSQKCHLTSFPLTQRAPIIVDPLSEWFNIIIRFSIFPSGVSQCHASI